MKVGDYVRTEYGISKCIKVIPIRENSFMYEFDKEVYEDVNYLTASELEKYKSSPNIIDLIEVGDFINGQKVFDKLYDEKNACWYLKLEIGEVFGKYARTYEQHIKSIVTKEAYASVEYRVETD